MAISRSRLDKLLSDKLNIKRKDVRLLLAQKRVFVDGSLALDIDLIVDSFSLITVDGDIVQANQAKYVMLHKPVGVVSATKDELHKTVIDLLDVPYKSSLHIAGRLDLNSSGLLLLTNDSRWSERLSKPDSKVAKSYQVTLANKLTEDMIPAFLNGMYFEFENITTKPAKLEVLSDYVAKVELVEGKYHQIKRMFGRFRNPVVKLHRQSIGNLQLDVTLKPGESRELHPVEVQSIF
ncbi:16S rRNA pseudouridine(516) synthase [Thalassotalea psychrophila]|uniref:Pseudouridine synthase n=1 Tax=Thalassotalea psychrophila TaxID=3065647 RepID=A0ABY9TX02_9GAMM|nr:16S rRNA pseudouridine(516) synthase [Colwelliaceae bacterium SQ149]